MIRVRLMLRLSVGRRVRPWAHRGCDCCASILQSNSLRGMTLALDVGIVIVVAKTEMYGHQHGYDYCPG